MREGRGIQKMWKLMVGIGLLSAAMVLGTVPVSAEAATAAQKEKVKQLMIDIYYSADTTSYNMLGYSLKTDEFNEIFDELQLGEHERMIGSYEHYSKIKAFSLGRTVLSIKLSTEDYDVFERYKRVNENADAILAGIEPEMDDLDKVIHLHDSIVELVTYNKNMGDHKYTLGGALGDKNAVCMGYAEALNLLLKETGFETDYVFSDSVDHGWSYVKLDGEWYHIDPTWDDTRSSVKGQTSRQFLLRNEAEFMAGGSNSHGTDIEHKYGSPTSESTKYSDWFMHNVIGKMAFEDGMWYFVDPTTKDIVRADADGSEYETVVKYTGQTLAVVDAEDDTLVYTSDGQQYTKSLLQIDIEIDEEAEDETVTVPEEEVGNETVIDPEEGNGDETVTEPEEEPGDEVKVEPVIGLTSIQGVDLNDDSLWCEGQYNAQGTVEVKSGYFSTVNRYLVQAAETYVLNLKDTRFRVIVHEYAADGRLVAETEMLSGEALVMNEETECIGLSTYMPAWPGMPQTEFYKKLQYSYHTIEFMTTTEKNAEEQAKLDAERTIVVSSELLGEANLNDSNLWCEGKCNERGNVEEAVGYFSTINGYAVQPSGTYVLTLVDTRFDVFVCEYSADGKLIIETKLHSGDMHIMSGDTEYVGITMHMPVWFNMPWDQFVKKLNNEWKTTGFVLR